MSRPIPAAFINKNTYGVSEELERDRLPALPATYKCSLRDILFGKNAVPTRVCLSALPFATDPEDIAKLVVGAIMNASGTSPTSAKIERLASGNYVDQIKEWANMLVYGVGEIVQEGEMRDGGTTSSKKEPPFPVESLPEWVQDLDIDWKPLEETWAVDEIEMSAYAGVLAFSIGKEPTAENLDAYNARRRGAIRAVKPSGEFVIFVDESPYLTLEILQKVHRAFNSILKDRAAVIQAVVNNDDGMNQGPAAVFYSIFRLSAGASLNPLLIITRFARKYPSFYGHFKDLETEYHAAAHALQRFLDVPHGQRMYLKVIFGSAYIPVPRGDVNELLGVAAFALRQTETTLANYQGGTLSVYHRQKLVELLGVSETQAAEEVAEEVSA